jgi:cytochrome c oxidase cbb3-type subunit III
MSERVGLFIAVFTLLNILACLWLIWWTNRGRQPKSSDGPGKTGHVWDGDLEEYNNPMPLWWLGLFLLTIAFALAYLIVFPGLGTFAGTQRWSQIDQYRQQQQQLQNTFEASVAPFIQQPLPALARNSAAMAIAKNLFAQNCTTCHGSDARGAKGFPNLTDADSLYGADADTLYATIANGRNGIMPALGGALGDQGVNEAAAYVVSLSKRKVPVDWAAAGKERFAILCAACHLPTATGNPALGAPNLSDDTWLHGGDFDTVRASITHGRNSQMPAHLPLLGETKVRLLAAYVLQLSRPPNGRSASN